MLKDANGRVGPSDLSLKVGLSSSARVIRSALSRVDEIVAGSVIGEVADLAGRVGITDTEAGSMDTIIPLRDVWDYVSAKLQHDVSKEPVGEYERIAVAAGDEADNESDGEGTSHKEDTARQIKQEYLSVDPAGLSDYEKAIFKQVAIIVEEVLGDAPSDFKNLTTLIAFDNAIKNPVAEIHKAALPLAAGAAVGFVAPEGVAIATACITAATYTALGYMEYITDPEVRSKIDNKIAIVKHRLGLDATFTVLEDHASEYFGYRNTVTVAPDGSYVHDVDLVEATDDRSVRARKEAIKLAIEDEATKSISQDRCAALKAMPEEQLVQMFVDNAELSVNDILQGSSLWNRENVFGILKHRHAYFQNKTFNEVCEDDRIIPEVRYLNNKDWEAGMPLLGSSRFDAYAQYKNIVFDYKFGKSGVSRSEYLKILRNAPAEGGTPRVIQVRPTGNAYGDRQEEIGKYDE